MKKIIPILTMLLFLSGCSVAGMPVISKAPDKSRITEVEKTFNELNRSDYNEEDFKTIADKIKLFKEDFIGTDEEVTARIEDILSDIQSLKPIVKDNPVIDDTPDKVEPEPVEPEPVEPDPVEPEPEPEEPKEEKKDLIFFPSSPDKTTIQHGKTFASINVKAKLIADVEFYSGPDHPNDINGFYTITKEKSGTNVTVTGVTANGWLRIDFKDGKTGYAPNDDIVKN